MAKVGQTQYEPTDGLEVAFETGKAFLFSRLEDNAQVWVAKSQCQVGPTGEIHVRKGVLLQKFTELAKRGQTAANKGGN